MASVYVFLRCVSCFSSVRCSPQLSRQTHHSRDLLPSNGEFSSTHALYNQNAADKRRGGVGGKRTVEISAASYSQQRDFTAEMSTDWTHNSDSEAIEELSEQTAKACTVKDTRRKTMNSQQPNSEGDQDIHMNHRSDQITLEIEI